MNPYKINEFFGGYWCPKDEGKHAFSLIFALISSLFWLVIGHGYHGIPKKNHNNILWEW